MILEIRSKDPRPPPLRLHPEGRCGSAWHDKPLKQLGLLSRQADIRRVTGASSVNLRQGHATACVRHCPAGRCRTPVDHGHPPRSGTGGVARRRQESSRVRRVEEHVVPVPSFPVLRRTQPSGYRYRLIPRQEKYLLSRFADGCRRADGICCTDQDRRRMQ
jgi:hypothetical protein